MKIMNQNKNKSKEKKRQGKNKESLETHQKKTNCLEYKSEQKTKKLKH